MNFLGIVFLLIQNRDKIIKIWEAIQPLLPLLKEIASQVQPQLGGEQPTVSYDLTWVQETLNMLGEDLEVDGEMGPATEAAVRRFQEKHGLEVDGDPGAITRAYLYTERQKLAGGAAVSPTISQK